MEAIVFNLFRDVPVITRAWIIGCIGVSIMTSTGAISRTDIFYNYELVFRKRQYLRVIYSLFDLGEFSWSTIVDILISANNLGTLENALGSKRRFLWMSTLILAILIIMTSFVQPFASLGSLMHQNLVYYLYKTRVEDINIPFLGGNQLIFALVPLNTAIVMYFVAHRSLLEVSLSFIAGHILYYCDDVLLKLYGFDIGKTPYDYWIEWRERNRQPVEAQ